MNIKLLAAVAAAAASTALAAHAGTPALSFDQTAGQTLANPPYTLGWEFSVNKAIKVDGLGFFDDSQDGLAESHDVGLWDNGGTLLASTTIDAGIVDTLIAQWRYKSVTPVTLGVGNYFIGAFYQDGADNVYFPGYGGTVSTIPQVVYNQSTFGNGGALTDPTIQDGQNGFFGPNFTAGGVPEPMTWALMLMGFGGMGAVLRSRRAAATA